MALFAHNTPPVRGDPALSIPSCSLTTSLPPELLHLIFLHVRCPHNLVLTCRTWHRVGSAQGTRRTWLNAHFPCLPRLDVYPDTFKAVCGRENPFSYRSFDTPGVDHDDAKINNAPTLVWPRIPIAILTDTILADMVASHVGKNNDWRRCISALVRFAAVRGYIRTLSLLLTSPSPAAGPPSLSPMQLAKTLAFAVAANQWQAAHMLLLVVVGDEPSSNNRPSIDFASTPYLADGIFHHITTHTTSCVAPSSAPPDAHYTPATIFPRLLHLLPSSSRIPFLDKSLNWHLRGNAADKDSLYLAGEYLIARDQHHRQRKRGPKGLSERSPVPRSFYRDLLMHIPPS